MQVLPYFLKHSCIVMKYIYHLRSFRIFLFHYFSFENIFYNTIINFA